MVFNATVNHVSLISWRSDLLVEKTTDMPQVADKLYQRLSCQVHPCPSGIRTSTPQKKRYGEKNQCNEKQYHFSVKEYKKMNKGYHVNSSGPKIRMKI